MIIEIKPEETGGEVRIPPSKSISHRAIFAASLANGTSSITNILLSDDIRATIEACRDFGAVIVAEPEEDGLFSLKITGTPDPKAEDCLINCDESGSTVRFLIPVVSIDARNAVITGEGKLTERPLDPIINQIQQKGIEVESGDKQLPLILSGHLQPGVYELPGDVSSQFITGLMFALPLLDGDSKIVVTSPLQSKPYIEITIDILKKFGIEIVKEDENTYSVEGGQSYKPNSLEVEGDFSQAAFFFVNGAINRTTILKGLPKESVQGDYAVIDILKRSGAQISWDDEKQIYISEKTPTRGFRLDCQDTPDLVPILAVYAALSEGSTQLYNAGRLRIKESDRLHAIYEMLTRFGVNVSEEEDAITVFGQNAFQGATISSHKDHRIAMSAAIASGRADGTVFVEDAQSVNKSWPGFWEDFEDCGAKIHVV